VQGHMVSMRSRSTIDCVLLIPMLAELRVGFRETEETLTRLTKGSDAVRAAVTDTQYVFGASPFSDRH
jgi:hypothetical protein